MATGAATSTQSPQNTALTQVDLTTNSLSGPIITIGGKQVVSLQLLEQSGIPFDRVILDDLTRDFVVQVDQQVLSGTGTSGQAKGLLTMTGTNAITYTSASPTVASNTHADSFLSRVLNATEQVFTHVYEAPNAIVMHPRRWNWILDALDTTGRPLVPVRPTSPPPPRRCRRSSCAGTTAGRVTASSGWSTFSRSSDTVTPMVRRR